MTRQEAGRLRREVSDGTMVSKPEDERLRVQLLGGFRIWVGSRLIPDTVWHRRKAAALIKLLALTSEHRLHREEVLELLWPELAPGAGENNLHRTLHIVRHALEPELPPGEHSRYLSLKGEVLVLCPDGELEVDVDAFLQAAHAACQSQDPERHEQAIALCTGDLLPEDRYEDWVTARREELKALYHDLLRRLRGLYQSQGGYGQAIEVLRQPVQSEPADEEAHRQLMQLYALDGQRAEALRQFERLGAALRQEVDAEPDPSTLRLYKEIRTGRFPAQPSSVGKGDASTHPAPTEGEETNEARTPDGEVSEPHEDAPGDSSPLTNLPGPLSTFVGREQDIAEVKRLLPATRLLTLTGTGGVGKSRLALHVAAETLAAYPGEVWLVQLAAISNTHVIAEAVAGVLGVREQPDQSIVEAVAGFLRTRDVLLVLDNCEHLIDACADLAETLLRSCPRLRILATSRRPLGISGEIAWRVPSMAVPNPEDPAVLDSLRQYDAVSLFLERTRSVRPDFALTAETAPAVVEVCRRLDGIPLAIELAAARMRVLTVEQLAERLDDCFAVLGGGTTSSLPRHRTLRATMDWSHSLLSEPERVLFRRLAVFAGGWTLEAVEGICGGRGIEEWEILEILAKLVDHSLVMVTK